MYVLCLLAHRRTCTAGILKKARKTMIHQPGGLAGHLRGSAAQQSPALPPTALAGPAVSRTQQQTGPKRAQHAELNPRSHPGNATAAVTVAGDGSKGNGTGAGELVSNSRVQSASAEVQKAGGMSWNPVRLSSPFEKASEPTGSSPYYSYRLCLWPLPTPLTPVLHPCLPNHITLCCHFPLPQISSDPYDLHATVTCRCIVVCFGVSACICCDASENNTRLSTQKPAA